MKPTLTLDLIKAASHDAACRRMRSEGRSVWNAQDASAAWGEYDRLMMTLAHEGESLEDCIIRVREATRQP